MAKTHGKSIARTTSISLSHSLPFSTISSLMVFSLCQVSVMIALQIESQDFQPANGCIRSSGRQNFRFVSNARYLLLAQWWHWESGSQLFLKGTLDNPVVFTFGKVSMAEPNGVEWKIRSSGSYVCDTSSARLYVRTLPNFRSINR